MSEHNMVKTVLVSFLLKSGLVHLDYALPCLLHYPTTDDGNLININLNLPVLVLKYQLIPIQF